jgi:tetratricopeptide (TPR) repeat protein
LPEVAQTLTWAVHRAIERNRGARVLLFIDDVDMLDGGSLHAVSELCRGEPIPGFFMVMTSERGPAGSPDDRIEHRLLTGLSREEAAAALGHPLGPYDRFPLADDIEPLYLEHWNAFRAETTREAPESLAALIAARIEHLPPDQVRALQSLAITGGGALGAIALTMSSPEELEAALEPLSRAGFAWIDGNAAALSHALIGPIVLDATPESVVSDMHDRAANALQSARDIVELRAYHAVRGRAGLDAFLLLEDAAHLRSIRGDVEGAVAMLADAVRAARLEVARGGGDLAASAYVVFGRKLATALTSAGRLDEACGVLAEMHDATRPSDVSRALVCEQLAVLAQHRGHEDEAARRWSEALSIAEQRTDYSLVQRFRRPIPPLTAPFITEAHRGTIVPVRSTAR